MKRRNDGSQNRTEVVAIATEIDISDVIVLVLERDMNKPRILLEDAHEALLLPAPGHLTQPHGRNRCMQVHGHASIVIQWGNLLHKREQLGHHPHVVVFKEKNIRHALVVDFVP